MSDQPHDPGGEWTRAANRKPQTFEGVQILRGFAASMVVFHHMCFVLNSYRPGASSLAAHKGLAALGAAGVDVFFCISGLVIAHASRQLPAGWRTARTFAWRRILRVLPPYWVYTLALLLAWVVGVGFRELIMTPGLVAASLFLIPYPKATLSGAFSYHPILDVGWTLAFEMYFYAVCALVIAFKGGRRIWPLAMITLAIMALAAVAMTGSGSVASSVLASSLLIEFCFGVLVARFLAGNLATVTGIILVSVGTIGLVASAFLPDPIAWRLFCWGIPGALLVMGAVLLPISMTSRPARLLGFLGTSSYTIYLAHPLFLLPLGTMLKQGYFAAVPGNALLIAATIVGIGGSMLTYFVVEGPLVRLLKPRSRTAAMARETVSV